MNSRSSISIALILGCLLLMASSQSLETKQTVGCRVPIPTGCSQCLEPYVMIFNFCVMPRVTEECKYIDMTNNVCIECKTDFYLSPADEFNGSYNSCKDKRSNCATYINGGCVDCMPGFTIEYNDQGFCEPIKDKEPVKPIDFCIVQIESACYQCEAGHQLIEDHACSPIVTPPVVIPPVVNPPVISPVVEVENCAIMDYEEGICDECDFGFVITLDGQCEEEQAFVFWDPNCRLFDTQVKTECIECAEGFYFMEFEGGRICSQIDPLCRTINHMDLTCLSCYLGYQLEQGRCHKEQQLTFDNNCHEYDFENNICLQCSEGSYFDDEGECVQFDDVNCKRPSKDLKGCLKCYKGYYYNVTQARCVQGNFNCAKWDDQGLCERCPRGFYLTEQKNCTQIDQFCQKFNKDTKECDRCYKGYAKDVDGQCKEIGQLSDQIAKYHQFCSAYDEFHNCKKCYRGYFIKEDDQGTFCSEVSQYCRTHSKASGRCTSCYFGYYKTVNGECKMI